ncbi:MAG: MBL-fold metallo-hydrolase [Cytophagales bacterium]|nr:MBL fold metallo-hydrolase [Bacteroidota bacterium]MBS1980542.1 MBL fold metallo-hydrolase [Bacteroidota bacterium]WHZ07862.1 MAG: MBL-fold metallo-hydrolase [Cytophagales bacterium]
MKITFLGTGTSQGVPVIGCTCEVCRSLDYRDKRLRVSVHLEIDGLSLVIDTGPDFRQQMLREHISTLDAVILTHSHKDHIAGLDDVRAFNYLQKKEMPVYGSHATLEQVKNEFHYAFTDEKYPGTPLITLHEIDERIFLIQKTEIIPLPVMHLHMPVMGFRVGDFSYITDANYIPEKTLAKLKGTRLLVLNALQKEPHLSHFTLDQAILQAKCIGATQTYFTHMSHKMGMHHFVGRELPEGIALAYDGLTINL